MSGMGYVYRREVIFKSVSQTGLLHTATDALIDLVSSAEDYGAYVAILNYTLERGFSQQPCYGRRKIKLIC